MRIAIPYDIETKSVFPSTGCTEVFYIASIDLKTKEVNEEGFYETEGRTHHQLPLFLSGHHVEVRICTHLGRPLLNLRNQNGIRVFLTDTLDLSDTVSAFLERKLPEADDSMAHECSCQH